MRVSGLHKPNKFASLFIDHITRVWQLVTKWQIVLHIVRCAGLSLSKKWLNATFLSFTGFASRIRSRAAKPAKYENLWVFIRSDAHVVRAGLNIRGCGPLSTQGFFDTLSPAYRKVCRTVFPFSPIFSSFSRRITG